MVAVVICFGVVVKKTLNSALQVFSRFEYVIQNGQYQVFVFEKSDEDMEKKKLSEKSKVLKTNLPVSSKNC